MSRGRTTDPRFSGPRSREPVRRFRVATRCAPGLARTLDRRTFRIVDIGWPYHPQPDREGKVFDRKTDYPCAVTSHDDAGLVEGIRWCINHKVDDEALTLWVPL